MTEATSSLSALTTLCLFESVSGKEKDDEFRTCKCSMEGWILWIATLVSAEHELTPNWKAVKLSTFLLQVIPAI